MACMYCNFEMCFQCEAPVDYVKCCCGGKYYQEPTLSLAETPTERKPKSELWTPPVKKEPGVIGQPPKEGSEMKDVLSTGRKRAVVVAKIEEGMICEWAGLAKAGGGVKPIIGCYPGNEAKHVHHGPDKSVLNNVLKVNLHRVCHTCHNRWHANNDEFYGKRPPDGEPFLPVDGEVVFMHDAFTKAGLEDQMNNEIFWSIRKDRRDKSGLTGESVYDMINTPEGEEIDAASDDFA